MNREQGLNISTVGTRRFCKKKVHGKKLVGTKRTDSLAHFSTPGILCSSSCRDFLLENYETWEHGLQSQISD